MSKQKLKHNTNPVGATSSRPCFEAITKKQNAITLIALIITIIVMLILVGVTVNVALNGGLFTTAKRATRETEIELEREQLLSAAIGALGEDGKVDFDKLDNNLPDGFETTDTVRRYKSTKTGNIYTVSEYGTVTLVGEGGTGGEITEGPLGLKVEIGTVSPVTLLISYNEIPELTEENITDEQTINILARAFGVTGEIGSYEMLYEKIAQAVMKKPEITYDDLLLATGVPNPTIQDVFLFLVDQAGFAGVETPQEAAIGALDRGMTTLKVELLINNEDKTELMIGENDGYLSNVEYAILEHGEYQISLEIEGIKDEVAIKVDEQAIQTIIAKWDTNKVDIRREGISFVPIPKNFEVLTTEEKPQGYTIDEGLVITDGENEFVWIPVVKDFGATYTSGNCSEPKYLKRNSSGIGAPLDSQTVIDYYYGKKDDGSSYYTIDINSADLNGMAINTTTSNRTTFDYGYHYNEMVTSVNKYNGFYIGRYETTIDENNKIGSKEGATILSTEQSIEQTNNKPVRWWGLYAVQRNSDVKGNGSIVQTNMIWGQQWDAMLAYFTSEGKIYTETEVEKSATVGKQNAGQAKFTYNNKTISDEICNIYDLRGNAHDRTAEALDNNNRVSRGGRYDYKSSASSRGSGGPERRGRFGQHWHLYSASMVLVSHFI